MLHSDQLQAIEAKTLANYAILSATTKGRAFPEATDKLRTPFQRDRDRIVHSRAFRRLKGKTQVMSPGVGPDHLRDRLTHTMEVAQISRNLARNLTLNEDVAEAIALAHDLGHTPFGHAGEEALDAALHGLGRRFEHNRQSKRIVEDLEVMSPDFNGLNLSLEILEGLQKHQSPFDQSEERFVGASLEAQVVNLADEIAYLNHDVDDGLSLELITLDQLNEIELWREASFGLNIDMMRYRRQVVSRMIKLMLSDLLDRTTERIQELKIDNLASVYALVDEQVVRFSDNMRKKVNELRRFLYKNFYLHPDVEKSNKYGQKIITDLVEFFVKEADGEPDLQKIADYVAGMTDNFAKDRWQELCV